MTTRKSSEIDECFKLGMSFLYNAVAIHDTDPTKSEEYVQTFFQLLADAKNDMGTAHLDKDDRVLKLMIDVNNERVQLLQLITELQKINPTSSADLIARSNKALGIVNTTYGQLLYCYNNKLPPPLMKKVVIKLRKPIIHDEVSPCSITFNIKDFKAPATKGTYTLQFTNPFKTTQPPLAFPNLSPGKIGLKFSFNGIPRTEPSKLQRSGTRKLSADLLLSTKKTFGGFSTKTVATLNWALTGFNTTSHVSETIKLSCKDGEKGDYSITIDGTIYSPFQTEEFSICEIPIHATQAPSAPAPQPKPQPAPKESAPKPASKPTAQPKPVSKPAAASPKQQSSGFPADFLAAFAKNDIDPPYIIPEADIKAMVSYYLTTKLVEETQVIVGACTEFKVNCPKQITDMLRQLEARVSEIEESAESLGPEAYVVNVKKAMGANVQAIKSGKLTPEQSLQKKKEIFIMKEELENM